MRQIGTSLSFWLVIHGYTLAVLCLRQVQTTLIISLWSI